MAQKVSEGDGRDEEKVQDQVSVDTRRAWDCTAQVWQPM